MNLSIGEKIMVLRKRKGLSQKELADALGISVSNIPKYEGGFYNPGMDILIRISSFFEVTTDYLLKG